MAARSQWVCDTCGCTELYEMPDDAYLYCQTCHNRADLFLDTGVDDQELVATGGDHQPLYQKSSARRQKPVKEEPFSQSQSVMYQSQLWKTLSQQPNNTPNSNKFQNFNDSGVGMGRSVKKEEPYYDGDDGLDAGWPSGPSDFSGSGNNPSGDDYVNEVRMRYVMGVQLMIQAQCRALVENFGVNPLICGFAGTTWLRLVADSNVFEDNWDYETIRESEENFDDDPEKPVKRARAPYRGELHNLLGERAIMVWFKALRKTIPLSSSLVVSFLACHIAREAILPTDIVKWSLEGKLPYFTASVEIEERIGRPSKACPISSSFMFRPSQAVSVQKLESRAASIAESVGLDLPPVNFYAIASRFLKLLSLPVKEILDHSCRIYEWSMPPDLWLSNNELRLPARVCVMSILIVAVRILYNINGFGKWEMSLSRIKHSSNDEGKENVTNYGSASLDSNLDSDIEENCIPSRVHKSEFDAGELLCKLEKKYYEIDNTYEYSKDLSEFLIFCKDVAFAGTEPSFNYYDEEKIIEELWNYYQEEKDVVPSKDHREGCNCVLNHKRSRDADVHAKSSSKESRKSRNSISSPSESKTFCFDNSYSSTSITKAQNLAPHCEDSVDTLRDEAIKRLKADMEENRFCYIPPRVNLKRFDYLHYIRKRDEGALTYVAHADYYILLRACAKVAQVDTRIMHIGVLSFERRLAWLEKRIDHCLHLIPPNSTCDLCSDKVAQDTKEDCIGLSGLKVS